MSTEPAGTLDFDVVIVGGRPAGASLAARLGARGVRVLVVDRAELRSQPAVPSCPVV
jgi:flavin-dependent dehydrogenase